MRVLTTINELNRASGELGRSVGLGGVLVPTMGALHSGHASLVEQGAALARSRGLAPGCIATIFVNPTQFNEKSDFDRYPRTLEADLALCERAGAWGVFAPAVREVYPEGTESGDPPVIPPVATVPGLEDAARPGHFAGVCRVMTRLLDLLAPEVCILGEKDWQQVRVIAGMAHMQRRAVEIVAAPTVRDPDGLAMSSRNVFLSADARARAPGIYRALRSASSGRSPEEAEAILRRELIQAGLSRIEYAVVRDAVTLLPLGDRRGPGRALVAVRESAAGGGDVRLIDNAPWPMR